jgi:Subtilase family
MSVLAKALVVGILAGAVSVVSAALPAGVPSQQQSLEVLGAASWHAAGYRGEGIRIALLDTGFHGYRTHLGQCLPQTVVCRSFRRDGNLEARNSEHGILCGEILHAIAPDAELLFANWEDDQPEQFLEAVAWARSRGAKVLSCSVIMPSWSDGNGGGIIDERLQRLLGTGTAPGDALFFASAGNTALRHWRGPFQAGPGGWHQWSTGISENVLRPWSSEPIGVELYCHGDAIYELRIEDSTGKTVRTGRNGLDGGRAWSTVKLEPRAGSDYRVKVRLVSGNPGEFHLVALGASLSQSVAEGSVSCPADAPAVIAVGAMASSGETYDYSSRATTGSHSKPELMAIVPFASGWRARPFSGTSAAAPQAAGAASLYWSRFPTRSAAEVKEAMCQAAHRPTSVAASMDLGGYGRVSLPSVGLPANDSANDVKSPASLR